MACLIEAMAHERRSNLLCLVDVPVGLAKLDEVLHYVVVHVVIVFLVWFAVVVP